MSDFTILNEGYKSKIKTYIKEHFEKLDYPQQKVVDAMKYSLLSGGKRTRGVLILGFCDMFNICIEDAVPIACAIEMLHCYSLIHDDLPCIDDDDIRRGQASCHKKHGEDIALLAGDALLIECFSIISNSNLDNNIKIDIIKVLSKAVGYKGMISGQVMDISFEGKNISLEQLQEMHRNKTGKLIEASCIIGAIISKQDVKIAKEYGDNIGLAFQIVDDILDVIGDQDILGKPINSDLEKNKNTYVKLLGVDKSMDIVKNLSLKSKKLLINNYQNVDFLCDMIEYLILRKV
ncbi:MAG: polyprenyl synthetase family protein [Oscillospiraceae bacterium]